MTYATDPTTYWAVLWGYINLFNDLLDAGFQLSEEELERYDALSEEVYRLSDPVDLDPDYEEEWGWE